MWMIFFRKGSSITMDKRTWAEVDLDAIAHNIKEIRKITNPNAKIMAVVKADAYGHGFWRLQKRSLKTAQTVLP